MSDMRLPRALTLLSVVPLLLVGCGQSDAPDRLAAASAEVAAPSLAQDLRPLHAEAVELAGLVLAASPEADVADVVSRVEATQRDLLAAVDAELAQAGRTPSEAAGIAGAELTAVRGAAGDEAVRLGVDALLKNHLEAVNAAKAAVVDGAEGAEQELANRVLDEQGAALQELAALS